MNKYILRKYFCGFVFFFLIFLLGINPAYAHKVMVFAWVDGDTIFTQSKFSGGKKVKGGKIAVYNTHKKILLEGKTDNEGKFSFEVPEKTTLKIVLYAGTGHRAEWTVPKEDIEDLVLYEPNGCSECNEGYRGRSGIFEVMPISDDISRIILEKGDALTIADQARREGILDLRQSALNKVAMGITDLIEINRVTKD